MKNTRLFIKIKNRLGRHPIVKSLGLLVVCLALAGLAFGGRSYMQYRQEILAVERDSVVEYKLSEIVQINGLLRQLGGTTADEARETLSFRLSSKIQSLEPLLAAADIGTRSLAANLFTCIANDQMAHPDYYLTTLKPTGSSGGKPVELVRHEQPKAN